MPADITALAKICHQANKAYCETLGDRSQKEWEDAEDWQRISMIQGVRFRLDHPDAPVQAQHEAWLAAKIADGWTHGPDKDPVKKTHPCLLSYDELPIEQRRKDDLSVAIITALKSMLA